MAQDETRLPSQSWLDSVSIFFKKIIIHFSPFQSWMREAEYSATIPPHSPLLQAIFSGL